MLGLRSVLLAALLLAPAFARAEQPAPQRPSPSLLSGLAGLAAYEAAAYGPTTRAPQPRTSVVRTPQLRPQTGLAGLAAYDAASYLVRPRAQQQTAPAAQRNSALGRTWAPRSPISWRAVRTAPAAGR